MSKGSGVIIFLLGACLGAATGFYFARRKFMKLADEEIQSVKQVLLRGLEAGKTEKENAEKPVPPQEAAGVSKRVGEKPNLADYAQLLKQENYRDYTRYTNSAPVQPETPAEVPEENQAEPPRVITPDEFGEDDRYDSVSLYYFIDGVVADEDYHRLSEEDIEKLIGRDSLTHFGEYEEDSVYVRNDGNMNDYEILRDLRTYEDILKRMPYLRE